MKSSVLTSIIRTVTPIIMGALITFLAGRNINLDAEFQSNLVLLIQAVVTALYYIIVRFLESKKSEFGWLLGSPTAPKYTKGR